MIEFKTGKRNKARHRTKGSRFFVWLLKYNKYSHRKGTSCFEESGFWNLQQQTKNCNNKTLVLQRQGWNFENSFKSKIQNLFCLWGFFLWNSINTSKAIEGSDKPLQSMQIYNYKMWQIIFTIFQSKAVRPEYIPL